MFKGDPDQALVHMRELEKEMRELVIRAMYIKKEVNDEIGLSHVDKHENFLQIVNDI